MNFYSRSLLLALRMVFFIVTSHLHVNKKTRRKCLGQIKRKCHQTAHKLSNISFAGLIFAKLTERKLF